MKPFFTVLLLCCFLVSLGACAGRAPSPKTAQAASKSYFKSYARKYPTSEFGGKNLTNVTINQVEEISYHFALVDVMLDFSDGKEGRALVRMQNKFPGGWRVVSWEVLEYRQ